MDTRSNLTAPEYAAAFKSARTAKNICLFAIFVALGLELASMFMVRFVGVLDPLEVRLVPAVKIAQVVEAPLAGTTMPALAPTTKPAVKARPAAMIGKTEPVSETAIANAVMWRESLTWVLDATKTLAPIICVLLVLALLLAVMLSLVGRLGGIAGLTSALFWSLVLLMLLTPWQHIFQGRFACGAMYSLEELLAQTRTVEPSWGAQDVSLLTRSTYYGRFAGLPVVTLLVWITVLVKFAIGGSRMTLPAPITSVPVAPAHQPQSSGESTVEDQHLQ